ncbi:gap junction delta-3 protein [Ornithorhynchus anatinus]|uniref:gap junction delta-3 protein n=1 Tax=Ornithorhynchus anatinus TaxID=9258 RepID=UPI0010A7F397|nr:gap junction delta-3 protein [Ornithorhynchus anatinus]
MGEWNFLSSLLDVIQDQSPLVGRFWLVVMVIFRILVLATVGDDLFEDEQDMFVCNTAQPGCKQACYDLAFPISHYRFWVFQIVLLSLPAVLYVVYSVHRATKGPGAGPGQPAPPGPARPGRCYVLSVLGRLLAEGAFLAGQALLYGFRVAPRFLCRRAPCPHLVDCYVSRPTEKTVFLMFYFCVGLLSAALSLAELGHLACKSRPWWVGTPGPAPSSPSADALRDNCCNRAQEQKSQPLLTLGHQAEEKPPAPGPDSPPAYSRCQPTVSSGSLPGARGGLLI